MQQTVKVTGVFTDTGENSRGPWTRYDVKDAGGNKYSTFDEALGKQAQDVVGRTVALTYEEKDNGKYVNLILKGVSASTGEEIDRSESTNGNHTQQQTAPSTKDEQIARAVAFKGAIDLAANGVIESDGPGIVAVAQFFEEYLTTGGVAEPATEDVRY